MTKQIPETQVNHDNSTSSFQQQLSPKTFSNQHLLPRLPVPDLHETCNKFIEWVQPLLSEEELNNTKQIVDEFQSQGGDGEKLQQKLINWSQRSDVSNWLEPFWVDMYLKYRLPIVVNLNVFYIFEENPTGAIVTQIQRAAALILSILKFKALIDREELEVDQERGDPLCMMQFKRLFSTTRIPKRGRDQLRSPCSPGNPTLSSAKHIVVLYKGHIFSLDVLSESGELPTVEEIERDLETVLVLGAENAREDETIGILTTMNRDVWADTRETLLKIHPQNAVSLETVETALFALCLDDSRPNTLDDLSKTMLHGDGRNRWFDKSLQFIVYQNGKFGVNMEHAGFDGSIVVGLSKFLYQDSGKVDGYESGTVRADPQKLKFHLNDELKHSITCAARDFDTFANNIHIKMLEFNEFGKEFIKSCQVSPDAFIQLALQLAQYKLLGTCYSTYEPVMTRRFLHGRTEAMRSVSSESVQFVENMVAADCDDSTKEASLRKAAEKHGTRIKECKAGKGVQRHLFGLLNIYKRFGAALSIHSEPKIFTDRGWLTLCHDTLCTSTSGSVGLRLAGFGPVVDDGFGVVYLFREDSIYFNISSRSDKKKDQLHQFMSNITQSLREMSALIKKNK